MSLVEAATQDHGSKNNLKSSEKSVSFSTRVEKNESKMPKVECFYFFDVYGTLDEKRSTSL